MQILDKEADSQDQKFQDHVSRQIKQLMKRAKTEETNADKEDQKGLQLDAKAKHTCKIADYLQNTDDGLEARARTQREAATSWEGNAAVMIAQANKEQQLFEDLHTKGSKLRASGQKLLSIGTELVSHAAALNATAHAHEKAKVTQVYCFQDAPHALYPSYTRLCLLFNLGHISKFKQNTQRTVLMIQSGNRTALTKRYKGGRS